MCIKNNHNSNLPKKILKLYFLGLKMRDFAILNGYWTGHEFGACEVRSCVYCIAISGD